MDTPIVVLTCSIVRSAQGSVAAITGGAAAKRRKTRVIGAKLVSVEVTTASSEVEC